MNTPASNFSEGVDLAFKVIFGIGIFFLIGITLVMIYFVIRYRRKAHPVAVQIKERMSLEVAWTVVPFILVMLMFYYGYVAFSPMRNAPPDAMPVKVIGKMWFYTFEYAGGKQSPNLVVPLNKPVKLDLYSEDVIHALFIPAFRIKEDIIPGKETFLWFTPTLLGEYEIFCTAYCGLRHSYMQAKVKVVSPQEFETWLAQLPNKAEEPEGLTILKKNACIGCHSLDGTKLVSASFKGLMGKEEVVETAGKERKVIIDEAYIHTSIFEPDHDIVKGYQKGIMKSYKGIVTDDEVKKIVEYLQTLK